MLTRRWITSAVSSAVTISTFATFPTNRFWIGMVCAAPPQQFLCSHRGPLELRPDDGGVGSHFSHPSKRWPCAHGILHGYLFRPADGRMIWVPLPWCLRVSSLQNA